MAEIKVEDADVAKYGTKTRNGGNLIDAVIDAIAYKLGGDNIPSRNGDRIVTVLISSTSFLTGVYMSAKNKVKWFKHVPSATYSPNV